jgi:membrane-bound metal-dependent hydrolase YbcI (DUF457 family)
MSPLNHLLIAWMIANIFNTDTRTRRFSLVAGLISDIDGFPILFSDELYRTYHHTFAHTLIFGIIIAAIFTLFLKRKKLGFSIIMLCFAAHLGADIIGTNWGVPVFAPFLTTSFSISPYLPGSVVYGIVNPIFLVLGLVVTGVILVRKRRTPLEFFSKKWDRLMADFLVIPFRKKCYICAGRAYFTCESCLQTVCISHTITVRKRILCQACEKALQS